MNQLTEDEMQKAIARVLERGRGLKRQKDARARSQMAYALMLFRRKYKARQEQPLKIAPQRGPE